MGDSLIGSVLLVSAQAIAMEPTPTPAPLMGPDCMRRCIALETMWYANDQ